ncbi:guanine nucleotide exchange factor [Anaeramoeba ignava]|uniref:Guanine nucleotide exchange factor n=1 Tax=Anaeramoeba ignava TaxID=1746090 RepID=A0A9Q0LWR6_ANAIG|nr:guanine nucleotide exchange factor [Anaeramoeba ignava]
MKNSKKILNLISSWITYFPYRWRNQNELIQNYQILLHQILIPRFSEFKIYDLHLENFLDSKPKITDNYKWLHYKFTDKPILEDEEKKQQKKYPKENHKKTKRKIKKNEKTLKHSILDTLSETEFAEQLSIFQYDLMTNLDPDELLHINWYEKFELHPTLTRIVYFFNNISFYVSWRILKEKNVIPRSKMMKRFMKIFYILIKMKDYQSAQIINSGVQRASIYRLKHSKSLLSKKDFNLFDEGNNLLTPNSSYMNYRDEIRNFEGIQFYIPFLSVNLTDLTFIHEGNQERINGMINFNRFRFAFHSMKMAFSSLFLDSNFPSPIPEIQREFNLITKIKSEKELFHLSLKREPREPDRYIF